MMMLSNFRCRKFDTLTVREPVCPAGCSNRRAWAAGLGYDWSVISRWSLLDRAGRRADGFEHHEHERIEPARRAEPDGRDSEPGHDARANRAREPGGGPMPRGGVGFLSAEFFPKTGASSSGGPKESQAGGRVIASAPPATLTSREDGRGLWRSAVMRVGPVSQLGCRVRRQQRHRASPLHSHPARR